MKHEYVMTDEDHKKLLAACQPVVFIAPGGNFPSTPQENANAAWVDLGKKMGFDPFTVQMIPGCSDKHFTAEPN